MQRKIGLYRGQRIDNGEWVEGSLYKTTYNSYIIPIHDETKTAIEIIAVSKETVGQFTGLTDKNGKKIFEGDILKYEDFIFIVGFTQAKFKALLKDAKDTSQILGVLLWCESDIIGNVTENPELLNQ